MTTKAFDIITVDKERVTIRNNYVDITNPDFWDSEERSIRYYNRDGNISVYLAWVFMYFNIGISNFFEDTYGIVDDHNFSRCSLTVSIDKLESLLIKYINTPSTTHFFEAYDGMSKRCMSAHIQSGFVQELKSAIETQVFP